MSARYLLALLLLPAVASADPVGLRLPGSTPQLVVEAGWRDASVALWFKDELGVAVDVGLRGEAVGGSFGVRHALVENDRGLGVDAFLSAGLRGLIADPGLALTLTPAIAAGSRGDLLATIGVAAPIVARLGRPEARVPVLVEVRLGGQPGPVSFGVRGALGAVLVPGEPIAAALQWSGWFAVELP